MNLWNDDEPIADRFDGIDVPAWIDSEISPSDVAAICEGGCASGAYMPAVTYATAVEVMSEHGDEVLEYIENMIGEMPAIPERTLWSWSSLACHFLIVAVEVWAAAVAHDLEQCEAETDDSASPEDDERSYGPHYRREGH